MKINKKNGFSILAVILVIVAVIVAIGIWALSGSSNTDSSSSAVSDTGASGLMLEADSIKDGFNLLASNGISYDQMTVIPNDNSSNNVLNSVTGLSSLPSAKSSWISSNYPNQQWTYSKTWVIYGQGAPGTAYDYVVFLGGVKDSICKKINKSFYGDETIPVLPQINEINGFTSGASVSNPNSSAIVDFTQGGAPINTLSWSRGCIRGGNSVEGNNVYFQLVKAN